MDLLGGIGSVLTGVGGLGSGVFNMISQGETNATNMAIYQQQRQDDDNAVQRRVADLKAAGLAPQLAAGGAATASAPTQVAPRMDTAAAEAPGRAMVDKQSQLDAIDAAAMKVKADASHTAAQEEYTRWQMKHGDDELEEKKLNDNAAAIVRQIQAKGMADRGMAALEMADTAKGELNVDAMKALYQDDALRSQKEHEDAVTEIIKKYGASQAAAELAATKAENQVKGDTAWKSQTNTNALRWIFEKTGINPATIDFIMGTLSHMLPIFAEIGVN